MPRGPDAPGGGIGRAAGHEAPRQAPPSGLQARLIAQDILYEVLRRHRPLDEVLAEVLASAQGLALSPRDRGLARLMAATVLRRHGALEAVLSQFMDRPLPERHIGVTHTLMLGAAQMLYLATPPHAAINLAVAQCRRHPAAERFTKLVNAVLRKVSIEGQRALEALDAVRLSIPDYLWTRWVASYGQETARAIAAASLEEAPLDLSIVRPQEAGSWAERLGGSLLATGSVRLEAGGRIEERAGYAEGTWWVQDAAAALPVRLFGENLSGRSAVDLCAAPGGKTAQFAALGAATVAVDVAAPRLERVTANLARLHLAAETVVADATSWKPGRVFDAVLLDAPCTATGTIRRHPDILHLKRPEDLARVVALQARLLAAAARLVAPGGTLVYATCSLEPQEGEAQVAAFLAANKAFARRSVMAGEAGIEAAWITPGGDLRTLPCHTPPGDAAGRGMDGFYAARLVRAA